MKKIILSFSIFCLCSLFSFSQCSQTTQTDKTGSYQVQALNIGDYLPDIMLRNIINYPVSTIDLSSFKGKKAVILDFFATWCGSCIAALPRLEKLQNKLKDQLQVFVVDYEYSKLVKAFLQQNAFAKDTQLPFITSDSALSKLFPYKMIPHEIWIDKNGQVQAITTAEYVTEENLTALVNGSLLRLPLKKDVMNYSRGQPLLLNGNGGNDSLLIYRGVLTRYIAGMPRGHSDVISPDSTTRRILTLNAGLEALYALTIPERFRCIGANRFIYETKIAARFVYQTSKSSDWNKWAQKNAYCYEITVPAQTSVSKIKEMMLQDINRSLGLNGRVEKRLVNCWAIIRVSKEDLLKSKGGQPENKFYNDTLMQRIQLHNQPLSKLVQALNNLPINRLNIPIVIDETSYSGMVDMELKVNDIFNIVEMQEVLKKYGLNLIPVKRVLPMFVITDKFNAE